MKVAKAKGRLRGKQSKLNPAQEKHHVELWRAGQHTSAELAELFSVARSTVYRVVQRASEPTPPRPRRRRAATASPSKPRTREHLR
jgi:DNA invertase Pin-like site-specific DNA recombinase